MRRTAYLCLPLVVIILVSAGETRAASLVTTPPGVEPGQGYQLAFVTDGVIDASSPDVADYDAFVTAEAMAIPELAALATSWRAVVSTNSMIARERTDTGATFPDDWLYQLDGSLLYTSFGQGFGYVDDFGVGLNITPTGAVAEGLAWTGTDIGGNARSPVGSAFPTVGTIGSPSVFRLDNGSTFPNSDRFRLYAVSGLLFVVPEPAAFGMVAASLLLSVGGERSAKRSGSKGVNHERG